MYCINEEKRLASEQVTLPVRVNAAETEPLIAPILTTACKRFNLQRDMTRSDRIPTIIIFYFGLRLRAQIKTNVSGTAECRKLYASAIERRV